MDCIALPSLSAGLGPLTRFRNIVVFRALQLGDMLCAVPALRALRQAAPSASITLVGLPWAERFVHRFHHYVDEFLPFPGHPELPEQSVDAKAESAFWRKVRDEHYDLAIQMHGDGRVSNGIVARFEAMNVAGFRPNGETPWRTRHYLPYPEQGSEIDRLLQLARFLGAPIQDDELEFPLWGADRRELERFGLEEILHHSFICLHAGARSPGRRWPITAFAAAGDILQREFGVKIVLTGSDSERELIKTLAGAMQTPALEAACGMSFGALAALLAKARLVVCNDTGVSHLAAALRRPSVVIFRASDRERWRPKDELRHHCVWDPSGIREDAVLTAARELLTQHQNGHPDLSGDRQLT